MKEEAAHRLSSRFSRVILGKRDFHAVVAGLTERIDLFLAFARLDHVMEFLVIRILGNQLCLLLAGNRYENCQHDIDNTDKLPITLHKFHCTGLFPFGSVFYHGEVDDNPADEHPAPHKWQNP